MASKLERFGMILQLVSCSFPSARVGGTSAVLMCALIAVLGLSSATFPSSSRAATCDVTPQISEVGRFRSDFIDEASGLALSPDGQSFFVTNDSGDKPRFFQTRLNGEILAEFSMLDDAGSSKAWKVFDVEALSVGPCPRGLKGDCIAIADIGDNRDRRKSVEIGFFRIDELSRASGGPNFLRASGATPLRADVKVDLKMKLNYPDGARNAEGFAILNSRYGLIVTKEQDRKARATKAAGAYVVDFETAKVERVATWDVPAWVANRGLSSLVTDISVDAGTSSSGTLSTVRVLLLTYRDAFELLVRTNLPSAAGAQANAKAAWPPAPWMIESRQRIFLDSPQWPALQQQETITYDALKMGFYLSTEVPLALLGIKSAPIRQVEKLVCP